MAGPDGLSGPPPSLNCGRQLATRVIEHINQRPSGCYEKSIFVCFLGTSRKPDDDLPARATDAACQTCIATKATVRIMIQGIFWASTHFVCRCLTIQAAGNLEGFASYISAAPHWVVVRVSQPMLFRWLATRAPKSVMHHGGVLKYE